MSPRFHSSFTLALVAGSCALFSAACHGPSGAPPTKPVTLSAATYVGSAACARCHPGEAHSHATSRHAHTLRDMAPAALGSLAPSVGPVPGVPVELTVDRGRFVLQRPSDPRHVLPLALALGSGKTGMTFVALRRDSLLEFHETYFPPWRAWRTTPGQNSLAPGSIGKTNDEQDARHCLGCHAVTLPETSLKPAPQFYGVGCESCHGPGSRHIAAEQQGSRSNTDMDDLSAWGARRLNEMCGRCHRTVNDLHGSIVELQMTNRFAPYGLMLSRCFRESGDTLSCITCHDPHTDASTDDAAYERVCRSCHSAASNAAKHGKICPVNPQSGCVSCHMPTRPVMAMGAVPTTMADHFIRVFPMSHGKPVVSPPSQSMLLSTGA